MAGQVGWNAQLNERRFGLIDRDIRGTLSNLEKLELAALTQLKQLRPPTNLRPDGIELSWFTKRERGQLPNSY